MMNHITMKYTKTPYKYLEYYWEIDGISLITLVEQGATEYKKIIKVHSLD